MTNAELRAEAARRLRLLNHEFVARVLSDQQLEALSEGLDELERVLEGADHRQRVVASEDLQHFRLVAPKDDRTARHSLFADSFVSGAANPLGLGASLRREGDVAVMEVTLGRAFEGAPGRAHGGVVAALVDETMGLVLALHEVLAFTGRLEISYLAPTPIGEPITARAELVERRGRKLSIDATVHAADTLVARASALFITVNPAHFLEPLVEEA